MRRNCDDLRQIRECVLLTAASNGELDAKLAQHLEHCSKCRMTLRSEKELFLGIDSALRAQMNEDPRADFLAQLRIRLWKEQTGRPESNRVWHIAGAALALVLIAMFYPLINARQPRVQGILTPTTRVPQSAGATLFARTREDLRVQSRHHSKRSAVPHEPEVLVPPDEQKAFAQFVARVARRDAMAEAVAMPASNKNR